jgi:imidazolonepropionase-like amidohydrolase
MRLPDRVTAGHDGAVPGLLATLVPLLLAVACGTEPEFIDRAGVVVLEGATLIDGTGSAPVASSAVVIEGERVVRVGAVGDFRYRDDVEVHDVTGRWILPGLIEMHAHLPAEPAEQERVLRSYLAHGVTTLANLAAGPATGLDAKARLANGLVEGPRMFTAGRALNGPSWLDGFPLFVRVESEQEVREEVRRQASSGVDLVKVYAHLAPDLVCAAVDEAHGAGLRVAGHLGETSWTRALECGIDILVHSALAGPTWELLNEPDRERLRRNVFPPRNGLDAYDPLLWNEWTDRVELDGPPFQELLALLGRPGVAVDPNLLVFESIVWSDDPALRRRAAFLAPVDAEAAGAAPHPATASWTPAGFESVRSAWPVFLEMIRRFHEAGVLLTAGSDFGNAWLTPGAALHRELELLASAGIPPLDVLTVATSNAAAVLGATGEIGVVAPGALADLVVLDRDPLEDVANVRSVVAVFQGGRRVEFR